MLCPCQEQSGTQVGSGHPPTPTGPPLPRQGKPLQLLGSVGENLLSSGFASSWLAPCHPWTPSRQALESLPLPDPFPPPWGQIARWRPQEHLSPNACRGLP